MPTRIAPLLASTVQSGRTRAKPYKLADGRGLFLLVQPRSGKWWRFVHVRPGTSKRNTLSLGTFPDVSLIEARERRDELRTLLAGPVQIFV